MTGEPSSANRWIGCLDNTSTFGYWIKGFRLSRLVKNAQDLLFI